MSESNTAEFRVCICTFHRPDRLRNLLRALDRLDPATPTFCVRVVDNDAGRSAAAVIDEVAGGVGYSLSYDVEPQQNIALARNRCLIDLNEPWIAFIDDDEIPDAGWLLNLWRCAETFRADAVFGPVVPGWPEDAPKWIRDNPVHNRARYQTGEGVPLGQTRTGNVLIRTGLLANQAAPFDAAYGLSGGSDTDLFKRLAAEGARYVWCDEAPVIEQVMDQRAKVGWLIRRYFRGGQNHVRQMLSARRTAGSRLLVMVFTLFRAGSLMLLGGLGGLVLWPVARSLALNLICRAAGQAGQIAALTPFEYVEYRPR